jgi:hypothetical protein
MSFALAASGAYPPRQQEQGRVFLKSLEIEPFVFS